MRLLNSSQRLFSIAGKVVNPGHEIDLDSAEAERHLKLYPGEFVEVSGKEDDGEKAVENLTKKEIIALLEEKGIEHDPTSKKADLIELF